MQGLLFSIVGAAGAILIVEVYRHWRTPGGKDGRRNLLAAAFAMLCGLTLAQSLALPPMPHGVKMSGLEQAGIHIGPLKPPLTENQKLLLIAGIGAFCVWILLSRRD